MSMLLHPARILPVAFLIGIAIGTALLMLPLAKAGPGSAPLIVALFTATSALSVTGLTVVDTGTYWSPFGQAVILLLFQLGGFGIMAAAALIGLAVARRVGLSRQLALQAEVRGSLAPGEVAAVLKFALIVTLVSEALIATILTLRFHLRYAEPLGQALWHGVFHGVSAFTNAGFSNYADSLTGFRGDALVVVPVALGVMVGGLGLPVLRCLRLHPRAPGRWSLHTKLTLLSTLPLFALGFFTVLLFEGGPSGTLHPLAWGERILAALFHAVMPRSGGFNVLDVGAMTEETLLITSGLMIVGGGSGGTAGGIKVTTLVILGLMVLAEVRGDADATAFGRRIPTSLQRQALALVMLALATMAAAILLMRGLTELAMRDIIFEVISAFNNVGLSTGVTAQLPPAAQLLLINLMFLGRVGIVSFATALALRPRQTAFRYPEERLTVG